MSRALAGPRPGVRRRSTKRGGGVGRIVGRIVKTLAVLLLFAVLLFVGIVAGIVASYSRNLPDINRMADYQPSRSTRVFARNGLQLANLFRENRTWIPIDRIPVPVRNAFIATEDRHFYQHHGVDFAGIARAAIADYRHQHLQGASTITQQLARRLFLSNEVSAARKIQEALLAMEIERYYTKGRDPRALPEHHVLRRWGVRHRGGGAHLFRNRRRTPQRGPSGDAGRSAGRAVGLFALREPRPRQAAPGARAGADGREPACSPARKRTTRGARRWAC